MKYLIEEIIMWAGLVPRNSFFHEISSPLCWCYQSFYIPFFTCDSFIIIIIIIIIIPLILVFAWSGRYHLPWF